MYFSPQKDGDAMRDLLVPVSLTAIDMARILIFELSLVGAGSIVEQVERMSGATAQSHIKDNIRDYGVLIPTDKTYEDPQLERWTGTVAQLLIDKK